MIHTVRVNAAGFVQEPSEFGQRCGMDPRLFLQSELCARGLVEHPLGKLEVRPPWLVFLREVNNGLSRAVPSAMNDQSRPEESDPGILQFDDLEVMSSVAWVSF